METNSEAELSFRKMWSAADARFLEKTKKSLESSPQRSLDDVLEIWNTKYAKQATSRDKGYKAHVGEVLRNILSGIRVLGGVAASGASEVIGPTALCFNAVSFLLGIPERIHDLDEGLALLFEEVSSFLQQFKIYEKIEQERLPDIDVELKRATNRILICFVDICALSIKVLKSSRMVKFKFKAKKALFDDDSGVTAELKRFQNLVNQQSRLSGAVTLEHVLKSQRNSDQLIVAHNEKKSAERREDRVERIRETLGLNRKAIEAAESNLALLEEDSVPRSGYWLMAMSDYHEWTSFKSSTAQMLLLIGNDKSGKSYLTSAVIRHLRSPALTDARGTMRVRVAYFAFSALGSKVQSERPIKDQHLPVTALKYMVAQLAARETENNLPELTALLDHQIASFNKDDDSKDLGEALAFFARRENSAVFLVFDGFDQLSGENRHELFEVLIYLVECGVRVMASGTEEAFKDVSSSLRKDFNEFLVINVEENNQPDINEYIERTLKNKQRLQGNELETKALRAFIREELPQTARGNFLSVHRLLERVEDGISSLASIEEIKASISNYTAENQNVATQNTIESLHASLNNQEVEQVNLLLVWGIYGRRYFTVEDLQAALFLCQRKSPFQPLKEKLRGKYAKIFYIDGRQLVKVDPTLEDFIKASEPPKAKNANVSREKPTISLDITINQAEVSTVQRFLWDLAERITFDRFPFDASSVVESKNRIGIRRTEAELMIVKHCLGILLDKPDDRTALLVPYAFAHLCSHLKNLKDFKNNGEVRDADIDELGRDLIDLFSDRESLKPHWDNIYNSGTAFTFLENDQVGILWTWLRELKETTALRGKARRWLEQATSDDKHKVTVLKDVAMMVSKQWLREEECSHLSRYAWLDKYIDLLKEEQSSTEARSAQPGNEAIGGFGTAGDEEGKQITIPTAVAEALSNKNRILRAVEWAQSEGRLRDKDELWYRRLGSTYHACNENEAAIEAFKLARACPSPSWRSDEGLAKAYAAYDKQKAIKKMKHVLEILKEKKEKNSIEKACFIEDLKLIADWQVQLGQSEIAIQLLREAIEHHTQDHQISSKLIALLVEDRHVDEAVRLLEKMNQHTIEDGKLSELANMMLHIRDFFDYCLDFEPILVATRDDPILDVILDNMQNAIKYAEQKEMETALIDLLLCRGLGLAYHRENKIESAVQMWQQCWLLGSRSFPWANHRSLITVARLLGAHYVDQAVLARKEGQNPRALQLAIEQLAEKSRGLWTLQNDTRFILSHFYATAGEHLKAREVHRSDLKEAISRLAEDEFWTSRYDGYSMIGYDCMHAGDDLNALSAFYLRKVSASEGLGEDSTGANINENSGTLNYATCDGRCGGTWAAPDDVWHCKICPRTLFDRECHEKVKNGTLSWYVCKPTHQWLYVPSWAQERKELGPGKVRVGGKMVDGRRVGGEIVVVQEWLETLKRQYGIEDEPPGLKRAQ